MNEYEIAIKIAGKLESSFNNALKGAKSGLSGLGTSGKVGALAMKGIGVAAKATAVTLAAAGGAIAAVGAYSVNVGKEFEAQMSTVQSISGATGQEFDDLKEKAKEMGGTTAFSATEAGQAMEYMAMAGWKTEDMLNGIDGIMNLAAATGEDLALTSDIVTDALTAFGLSAKDTNGFVDNLAQAARSSNTDVSMMGESFKQVATAAGTFGYSTKDVAVALGAMANSGIKGEKSGTMLAKAFSRMSGTNANATKAMKELDLSMFNTDGTARPLADVLTDMRDRFSGLTQAEKENYAYMLGGQSAMNGLLAIVNTSESDWNDLTEAINNSSGAAAEMAAVKLDNLEGDITLLKSAMQGFGISIYEGMNAPLRNAVQYGTQQINILQQAFDEDGFEGLASAIGNVLTDGIARLADNAPMFIDMTAILIESLIDGIDSNAPAIGSSMARLGTTIVLALLRIIPRVVTTGAHLMVEFAKGIIDSHPALKDAGLQAVEYFMESAKDAFKSFKDFLGDDEVEPFKKVLALLPALIGGFAVFDGIGGAIKGFTSSFKNAGKAVPGAAKSISAAGTQMSASAKNILGVGVGFAAVAAGIWLLADAAVRISAAGPAAVVGLVVMAAGIGAFMVLASNLGPTLNAASIGLIAFGASIILAATGMLIMVQAATQLATAGPGAQIAMALLAVGIIAFGAVAGTLAPLLLAGAAALAAFGAALVVVGGAMLVMNTAAVIGATALAIMAAVLPQLAASGTSGAVAILALGVSMTVFAAGATLAGVGAAAAAVGFTALAVAALAADVAFAPLAVEMATIGSAISSMAMMGQMAANSMNALKNSSSGMMSSMAKLATSFLPVTAALVPFAAASALASASVAALAAALALTVTAIAALLAMITATTAMFAALNIAITMFKTNAMTISTCMAMVQVAVNAGMIQIVAVTKSGMTIMVAVFRAGSVQIIAISRSTTSSVRGIFTSVNLASAGRHMMQGLINGMNSMRASIMATAQSIANSAANAVNSALKIHSPSKVMEQSGQFMGEGLAIGMENMSGRVQNAANASMAQPVQATNEAIKQIEAPKVGARSAVLNEPMQSSAGNVQGGNSSEQQMTFVFSPTYNFEGEMPDKENVVEANRMSQAEFERMMNEWMRKNRRTKFA